MNNCLLNLLLFYSIMFGICFCKLWPAVCLVCNLLFRVRPRSIYVSKSTRLYVGCSIILGNWPPRNVDAHKIYCFRVATV